MGKQGLNFDEEFDNLDLSVLTDKDDVSDTPGLKFENTPINMNAEVIESIEDLAIDKDDKDDGGDEDKDVDDKDKDVEVDDDLDIHRDKDDDDEDHTDDDDVDKDDADENKDDVDVDSDTNDADDDIDEKDDKENPLKVFAKMLDEKGIVDFKEDEFEDSDDYLTSLVNDKVNSEVQDYKDSLPDKVKEIIDSYEDGIPLSSFLEYEATLENYEAIKTEEIEENESLQKDLVKELLTYKGYTRERINSKLKRFEENGLLEDEAKDAQSDLIKIMKEEKQVAVDKAKNNKIEQHNQYKTWLTKLETDINKTEEIIPGFKLNDKQKKQLFNGITKVDKSGKNELTRKREKDANFDLKVAYLDLIINWDFSTFDKKAMTKQSNKLKKSLDGDDGFKGGKRKTTKKTKVDKGFDVGTMKNVLNNF